MKMNKPYILGLMILFSSTALLAHNPLSAKFYLQVEQDASTLTINLSQTGVHAIMKERYGEEASQMTVEAYQKALVQYLQSHCDIRIAEQPIVLKQGGVKLGTHQTDLIFLVDTPASLSGTLSAYIPAFSENEYHQSIFAYNLYGLKDRLILNTENNYRGEVVLGAPKATAATPLLPLLLGIAAGILGLLLLVRRLLAKPTSSHRLRTTTP